jgi:transposase-like protein
MNNLRNRGVEDILIAVVDGLKGLPDAITAAFPRYHRPDLHRASGAPFPELLRLEG